MRSNESIVIFGKQLESCEGYEHHDYKVVFDNSDELNKFYDDVRAISHLRNFNLNPYAWAAYGEFRHDNEVYHLSAPIDLNTRDRNWYEHHSERKKIGYINVVKSENNFSEIKSNEEREKMFNEIQNFIEEVKMDKENSYKVTDLEHILNFTQNDNLSDEQFERLVKEYNGIKNGLCE